MLPSETAPCVTLGKSEIYRLLNNKMMQVINSVPYQTSVLFAEEELGD